MSILVIGLPSDDGDEGVSVKGRVVSATSLDAFLDFIDQHAQIDEEHEEEEKDDR